MKKGKSTYQFPINVDPELARQTIMNWLSANSFELKEKDGKYYYQYYDPVIGRRLLEYYIQPGMVTINAYLGKFTKPYLLDDSFAGSVPKSAYKSALDPLFKTLASYNAPVGADGISPQSDPYSPPVYAAEGAQTQPAAGNYADFADAADKRNEKLAIWGFVISIIGLLLSFVGYTYGVVLYMLEFYFAACGIKTRKKGLAIATFVLAGISIVILVLMIFINALS